MEFGLYYVFDTQLMVVMTGTHYTGVVSKITRVLSWTPVFVGRVGNPCSLWAFCK